MLRLFRKLSEIPFSMLPSNDSNWYDLCRRYVDRYNGDNNDDSRLNGELHFMAKMLADCQIVFDVGANIGDWASLALSINPTINLHCFEPSQNTFQRLKTKIFPPHVILNNFGLGSTAENRLLYVFEDGSGINSLYQRHGLEDGWGLAAQQRAEMIELMTLDDYCQVYGITRIDYLKVDVEGHELEVFKGARRMLAEQRVAIIQFEYGGCNIDARVLLKDLFDFLQPNAYSLYKIYPDKLRSVGRYDQRLENFQYQNWIAMLPQRN